jgi:hypothetical protein
VEPRVSGRAVSDLAARDATRWIVSRFGVQRSENGEAPWELVG